MRILSLFSSKVAVSACALIGAACSLVGETDASTAQRMAALEARLSELEARLADAEQETKEVKVIAETTLSGDSQPSALRSTAFDILAGDAWRNLRWTQEEQWAGIRRGLSEEKVIELLGVPPRSVKSLKPRVDEVFYYETSLMDRSSTIKGSISFKDGKVVYLNKPNFSKARAIK